MTADPAALQLDLIFSPTVKAKRWQVERWTWAKLLQRLTSGPVADHKDCGLWAAVAVRGGRRREAELVSRGAVVLDVDHATATTLVDIQIALAGYEHVITTTYSSTPQAPRYRVVLPLSKAIRGADSRVVTMYVAAVLCGLSEELDATSLDPVHAMYWPAEPKGSGSYRVWHNEGPLMGAAALVADAQRWAKGRPQLSETGAGQPYGYDGPDFEGLTPVRQDLARHRVSDVIDDQAQYLAELLKLPEGEVDARGHGWESGNLAVVAKLMRLAGSAWAPLTVDQAQEAYYRILPDAMRDTEPTCDKWRAGDFDRLLERYGALPPPWDDIPFTAVDEDGNPVPDDDDDEDLIGEVPGGGAGGSGGTGGGGESGAGKPGTKATVQRAVRPDAPTDTVPIALQWLREEAGRRGLEDLFLHNGRVVDAPRRLGPTEDADAATARPVDPDMVMNLVHTRYRPVKTGRQGTPRDADSFRRQAVAEWLADPRGSENLTEIARVVRHPVFRADGTWLARPGYDDRSRLLYLPNGLAVPPVPARPDEDDLVSARNYLDVVLGDFPWATPVDRSNYLAVLMTPLLMEIFPPPYMFTLLTAPQAGSGKSLLAEILRAVYGGTMRADLFKSGEDEVRKFITSTLQVYSGPIIHIDNMSGQLASPLLDALLTSPVWSDRMLGTNRQITVNNDRLWVGTGNNVKVAGDTRRRTLAVRIDPHLERPQERTDFFIQGMRTWITGAAARSRTIHALATLVAHWVAEGMPVGEVTGGDGYEHWLAGTRGVIACAGLDEEEYGLVGATDWETSESLSDDFETQERYDFYAALYRAFGGEVWRAQQVVGNIGGKIPVDALPDHVRRAFTRGDVSMGRVIGNWLSGHGDTWALGLSLYRSPLRAHNATWWQVRATDDALRRLRQEYEEADQGENVAKFPVDFTVLRGDEGEENVENTERRED